MRLLIALATLVALATPSVAQMAVTPSEMLRSSVSNFIRPQTKALQARAENLGEAMAALCAAPSADNLEAAEAAFAAAATAYGQAEFLHIGPLMEDNRADRLLFWPDRRGIGLKQVQQILAEQDPSAANFPAIKGKSVAVQGFGALEYVLFGTGAEVLEQSEGAFRCAYGLAIADNIADIATTIAADWADADGIALRLTQPDPAYADFRTTTESLETIVGLVAHGLESLRDTRINPFIDKGDGKPNPKQALFWRSNQTIPMLRANIDGLSSLLALSGIVADPDLAQSIASEFARARADLERVVDPVEAAATDPEQAAALSDLVLATQALQDLIGEELSAALGLSVGFSSMDGD